MGDLGMIVEVPLLSVANSFRRSNLQFGDGLEPEIVASFGYSMSDIGGKVSYFDMAQSDPLPRTARMGYALTANLTQENAAVGSWKVISVSYGVQGEDELVWRSLYGASGYLRAPVGTMSLS
jgi:hypothetical protein